MTYQIHVSRFDMLNEVRGSGLSQGAQILDQILFSHAYARILNNDYLFVRVKTHPDIQILTISQQARVLYRCESYLV